MADAVRFYLGETFIYDIEIGLLESRAPAMQLGSFGRLGWTSWVKRGQGADSEDPVRWDCRYYPSEIIAHEEKHQSKDA